MPKPITTLNDLPDELIQLIVSKFNLDIKIVRQINRRVKQALGALWQKELLPHIYLPSRFFKPMIALSNELKDWPKLYLKGLKAPVHYSYKGKRISYISKTHHNPGALQKHASPYYIVYLFEGSSQLHALRARLPLELINLPIDALSQIPYSERYGYTRSNDECAGFIPIAFSGQSVHLFTNPDQYCDSYQHYDDESAKIDPSRIIQSFKLEAPVSKLISHDTLILTNGNYIQICQREVKILNPGPIRQLVDDLYIQEDVLYSSASKKYDGTFSGTVAYKDLPEDAVIIPLQLKLKQIKKPQQHNHHWAKKEKPKSTTRTFYLLYSESTYTLLSIDFKQRLPVKPVILKIRGEPLDISYLTLKHTDAPSGLSLIRPGWPTAGTVYRLNWRYTHEQLELNVCYCPDINLERQCRRLEYQSGQVLDMLATLRPASLDILPPKIICYLTEFVPIRTLRLLSKHYKLAVEPLWMRKVYSHIYHPVSKPSIELIDNPSAWPQLHYPCDYVTYTYKGKPVTHIVGLKDCTEYHMYSGTYVPKETIAYLYLVDKKLYTYPETTIPLNLADFPIDALFQLENSETIFIHHTYHHFKLRIGVIISGEKVIHIKFKTRVEGEDFRTGKVVLDHLYIEKINTLHAPLRQFVYETQQLLLQDGSFGTYNPSNAELIKQYVSPPRSHRRIVPSLYVQATPYKENETFFLSQKNELFYHRYNQTHENVHYFPQRSSQREHTLKLFEYFSGNIYSLDTPLGLVALFYGRSKNTNLQFFSPEGHYSPTRHHPHNRHYFHEPLDDDRIINNKIYDVELTIEDEYIDTCETELRQSSLGTVSIFYNDRPNSPFKVDPESIKYLEADDEYDRCIEMSLVPDPDAKLAVEIRELEYQSLQVRDLLIRLRRS